ncbi:MAG: hypothetical protein K6F99_03090 [Lachnospiraceae bacterium]|nr:hypothetical protein [Lachnospiraceae bacterium]
MKFPIFTSIILLVILLNFRLRRQKKKELKSDEDYWKKEREAFTTPRKDISNLPYIKIPEDLPLDFPCEDDLVTECRNTIKNLSKDKIINLNGMSNTDIRLTYGTLNYEPLAMADTRYLTLIRYLSQLGQKYCELGFTKEAEEILKYSLDIGSDVKSSFLTLANIYYDSGREELMATLQEKAAAITTLSRDSVVNALSEFEIDRMLSESEAITDNTSDKQSDTEDASAGSPSQDQQ